MDLVGRNRQDSEYAHQLGYASHGEHSVFFCVCWGAIASRRGGCGATSVEGVPRGRNAFLDLRLCPKSPGCLSLVRHFPRACAGSGSECSKKNMGAHG